MPTNYSPANARYSKDCHFLAREEVYQRMFRDCILTYLYAAEMTPKQRDYYDGEIGVDTILYVTSPYLTNQRKPIEFWCQERFRPERYRHFHEITITEWNPETDLPSEFYKMKAGLFVYGYANGDFQSPYRMPTEFTEVIVESVAQLFFDALTGREHLPVATQTNERTLQTFRVMPIQPMAKHRLWYRNYQLGEEWPK